MPSSSPWIVQTTQEDFERDVIQRSYDVPVVVDFWAGWCQPCRMLGPMLERLADEAQGKFVLVKADTEQMPEIAGGFQVNAIPAVFALRDGAIVDQFTGVLPEASLRAWLEGIFPRPEETLVAEARLLEVADLDAAEQKYRQAIAAAPNFVSAQVGLARVLTARGQFDQGRQLLESLSQTGALDGEGERLLAELLLRQQSEKAGGADAARAAAEAQPDNLELQLNLARALAAAGRPQEAMEIGLKLVRKDRQGIGQQAKEFMVQLFHVLGPEHELTGVYRRKLALTLY